MQEVRDNLMGALSVIFGAMLGNDLSFGSPGCHEAKRYVILVLVDAEA
jgi:hypothetical protein